MKKLRNMVFVSLFISLFVLFILLTGIGKNVLRVPVQAITQNAMDIMATDEQKEKIAMIQEDYEATKEAMREHRRANGFPGF